MTHNNDEETHEELQCYNCSFAWQLEELAPHIQATKDFKWEPYVKHRQVFGVLLCLKCDMFNDIVQCPASDDYYLEESHVYDAVQSLESFIAWIDTIKRLFPPSGLAVPPPTLCEFSSPNAPAE